MSAKTHRWEAEALTTLRRLGLAIKLRTCTCGVTIGAELCQPSRTDEGRAHLFESHTLCDACGEIVSRDGANPVPAW